MILKWTKLYSLRGWKLLVILSLLFFVSCLNKTPGSKEFVEDSNYTGSASCIECHERFYELWSPSHHGKAMQPITSEFINTAITLGQPAIAMEGASYQAVQNDTSLYIREIKDDFQKDYEVLWALGGKNVYYFLTSWEGGRLQTLPLAYDVHTKQWYNNPESAVRHFPNMNGEEVEDQALSWRDMQYTFNTSCYSCHVSQLENNFDLATNTYQTHWKEAGINCETCHGPAQEHIKAASLAEKKGIKLDSMHLVVTTEFTPEQHNASCAGCHAKMSPITASYFPGNRFFDNFDLTTLENSDFYPDGRDLGENYTMTSWYYYQNMGKLEQALTAYETSLKVNSEAILPLVNSSFLYSVSGNQQKAVGYLQQALAIDPKNEAANLNYGLLMAELNQMEQAETALRTVMEVNGENATAAYNLSIMVSSRDLNEACQLSQKAMAASPEEPKFAYTHAYFLNENKQQAVAIRLLEQTIKEFPDHLSSVFLLRNIFLEIGNKGKAIDLYNSTLPYLTDNAQAQHQLKSEIERIRVL